jgi:predicted metalloprotease with PDZ domain
VNRILYTVRLDRRNEHLADIELAVDGVRGEHLDLSMPAWIPGSYKIRDFARHVQEFDAGPAAWTRLDKSTWRVETGGRSRVRVRYAVYAHEQTVRTSHVDSGHAYLNGPALFLSVEGRRNEPHEVRIASPWPVATALERRGSGWVAPDYDTLVDSPIETSDFEVRRFGVAGRRHEFVVHGEGNYDLARIARDASKIVRHASRVFGEIPYRRYLFLLHPHAAGGGLEHACSTSLQFPPLDFKKPETYERFLNLVSHEYFHLWNVKRIVPASIRPFRYDSESYTELLWVMEGVTSYYSPIVLARARLMPAESYFRYLARRIQAYREKPGRRVESLAQASFNSWIHLYQPTEHSVNSQISYYEKGELVALLLDLELRRRTRDRASLDDVMRALYRDFARRGRGVGEGDVQRVVESIGGRSFRGFFRDYVHGLRELPFESVLGGAGLQLSRAVPKEDANPAYLGAHIQKQPEKVVVTAVFSGSPAAGAGLSAFDEIAAVDGYRATPDNWDRVVKSASPGDRINLHVFRNQQLMSIDVRFGHQAPVEYKIVPTRPLKAAHRRRIRSWLGVNLKPA